MADPGDTACRGGRLGQAGLVVTIEIGAGLELQLVREPRTTLDPAQLERLRRELLSVIRAGLGNEQITERQSAVVAIDVQYGGFVYEAGELVGLTSASVLDLDVVPAPVLYLGGTALAPHLQGKGYYHALLLTRFAIGAVARAAYFTTRTQSPIVCRALKSYRPYPFTPGTDHYQAAAQQIARELDRERFNTYAGQGPYATSPRWCSTADRRRWPSLRGTGGDSRRPPTAIASGVVP